MIARTICRAFRSDMRGTGAVVTLSSRDYDAVAFYQERKVAPRRFDNASRYLLVLLSRCFDWKNALVNVTPRTLIGWHRQGFGCSGVGNVGGDDQGSPPNFEN